MGSAQAQEAGRGVRTHDGFCLRLSAGVGSSNAMAEGGGDKIEVGGMAGHAAFGLGLAKAENLLVHVDIFDNVDSSPELKVNGTLMGEDADVTLSSMAFGAGLAYYFMPINLFVSFTLGSATTSLEEDGEKTEESEDGYGLDLTAGKEWWVSDNWGLGAAVQLLYFTVPTENPETDSLDTTSIGVLFTATYN